MGRKKEFSEIEVEEALSVFCTPPRWPCNQWFAFGPMQIYMRRSVRCLHGTDETVRALDIANVEVAQSQRGKGLFGRLLNAVDAVGATTGTHIIYVESVLNDRFADYLKRHGFIYDTDTQPPSFYRRVGQ
ncbi:MAG TPA: hypothetical protein VN679_15300 [Candidatus Acidoferrales bacterium]|nr:hypothetical protein [Candidatus Acidoferrales bacterium]